MGVTSVNRTKKPMVYLSAMVPKEVKDAAFAAAERRGESMADVVRVWLEAGMRADPDVDQGGE